MSSCQSRNVFRLSDCSSQLAAVRRWNNEGNSGGNSLSELWKSNGQTRLTTQRQQHNGHTPQKKKKKKKALAPRDQEEMSELM